MNRFIGDEIKVKYIDDSITRIQINPKGDWIDLRAAEDVEFKKGDFKMISLGVAMKLPDGYEAIVAPRSSTFKNFKIIMVNSIGIIDNSYCGNNDYWAFPALAFEDTVIHKNDRICQFRILKNAEKCIINEVKELDSKDRGGFGSTGIR